MELQDYFAPPAIHAALERYRIAQGAWDISHKLDLYQHAETAFGAGGDEVKQASFLKIYEALRGNWQVFRPMGSARCWDPAQIRAALERRPTLADRHSGIALSDVTEKHYPELLAYVESLKGLKPTRTFPVMAVSKFLHFSNPRLFPIYDTEIIWNSVFQVFKPEYRAFCDQRGLARTGGVGFYLRYMLWGGHLLRHGSPELPDHFAAWLATKVAAVKYAGMVTASKRYDATIFEFAAIGAAACEAQSRV